MLSGSQKVIEDAMPLIDLHRHLDGNIRLSTIIFLAEKFGIPLPSNDEPELASHVFISDKTTDLLAFLKKLDLGVSVIGSLDACRQIAYENVEDAINEGLDHVELRFSPYYMAKAFSLPLPAVVEAVVDGVKSANKEFDYNAKLLGILSRTFGVECCREELNALLMYSNNITAIDLAGDEKGFPAELFQSHFRLARDHGLEVTVHAGEADSAKSVWDSIQLLGASRIGHGVAAIRDQRLIEYMAKHRIGIESCLLSNYQTGTWTDIETHPVAQFLEAGIPVCLNTDDPGISNNVLTDEYALAKERLKMNTSQIKKLQQNSLDMAFLDKDERHAISANKKAKRT